MKISIEFDDTNPNDTDERIKCALHGLDMRLAISDFENELRNIYKYRELTEDQTKIVEEIREKFYECMKEIPDVS